MDKKKSPVFIDTNVFVIDLRYKDDANFRINRNFLDFVSEHGKGSTSILNLLELCGILSFNLNQQQISELFHYFSSKYRVGIIPSDNIESFIEIPAKDIMDIIYKKASFGDALIAHSIKEHLKENTVFVSWDAAHFKHLLPVKAMTPKEFLMATQR